MLKKLMDRLVDRYGSWRLVHAALAAPAIVLLIVLMLGLLLPVRLSSNSHIAASNVKETTAIDLSKTLEPSAADLQGLAKVFRPSLFKASASLGDRPMADRTIENIKSQLALKCVMAMKGEPVAYVYIKSVGLRQCRVGDSVGDLFTVLDISKGSVEISIVGHKVTLKR